MDGISIVAALCMAVLGVLYVQWKHKRRKQALMFKALATILADVLAIRAAFLYGSVTIWCFAAGIFLYACADILLEIWLYAGVGFFAAGHLILIAGLWQLRKPGLLTIGVCAVLLFGSLYVFQPYFRRMKKVLLPGCIYIGILCFAAAMMIQVIPVMGIPGGLVLAVGGLSFVVSDCVLGWSVFSGKRKKTQRSVVMFTYYLAVYCLGVAWLL